MRARALVLLVSCTPKAQHAEEAAPSAPPEIVSVHTELGAPRDADPSDDVVLDRRWFVVSYNPRTNDPNWVAWKLTSAELGSAPRGNRFHPDEDLAFGLLRVEPRDYARSGYDRGHLCPSGDRTASPEMNHATFVMTNMVPQRHDLNAGPWEELEKWSRERAKRGDVLHVVAGPLFGPGSSVIGRGVKVPERMFKVMLVTGSDGQVRADTVALAVIMPNAEGIQSRSFREWITSIDEVERESGYDFFSRVPRDLEIMLEAKVEKP